MTIYIARDIDGVLMIYLDKPKFDGGEWWGKSERFEQLPIEWFPNIKPGECIEFAAKGAVT